MATMVLKHNQGVQKLSSFYIFMNILIIVVVGIALFKFNKQRKRRRRIILNSIHANTLTTIVSFFFVVFHLMHFTSCICICTTPLMWVLLYFIYKKKAKQSSVLIFTQCHVDFFFPILSKQVLVAVFINCYRWVD